jgi:pimeloyl-ACP methyl ester carboxylesterase
MTPIRAKAGYFRNGLPYNRLGNGARPLVIFQGLIFENRPQSGLTFQMYRFLGNDYTVYAVLRKAGLPHDYALGDMADDYATMIREEFGGPVDVLGVSTGGSIVQHFAADHPDLVRRLVIHSSAHTLRPEARQLQLRVAHLAQQGQWRKAYRLLIASVFPQTGIKRLLSQPLIHFSAWLLALSAPQDPNDLVVTVQAEDRHAFRDRLAEIVAPTLVVAGENDPFYTPDLFRETAAGIPNARLCLYKDMGHTAGGKQFRQDVLTFLRDGWFVEGIR